MYQTDPLRSPKEVLPTMYDLPSEDPEEPALPDEFHFLQPRLPGDTFCPPNYLIDQLLVASDLNLYYDPPRHTSWYKWPDWFAVVGVSQLYEQRDLRLSFVKSPHLLSAALIIQVGNCDSSTPVSLLCELVVLNSRMLC